VTLKARECCPHNHSAAKEVYGDHVLLLIGDNVNKVHALVDTSHDDDSVELANLVDHLFNDGLMLQLKSTPTLLSSKMIKK
jgi:hypothetical protein